MISMGRSNSSCGRGSSVSLKPFFDQADREFRLLFPNDVSNEPLSENAMLALLKRMGYGHITVHGFRSTFKDWASEMTDYPDDLSDAPLAHRTGDKAKAAYKRETMIQKLRELMDS